MHAVNDAETILLRKTDYSTNVREREVVDDFKRAKAVVVTPTWREVWWWGVGGDPADLPVSVTPRATPRLTQMRWSEASKRNDSRKFGPISWYYDTIHEVLLLLVPFSCTQEVPFVTTKM
jgi:hypothetical protein